LLYLTYDYTSLPAIYGTTVYVMPIKAEGITSTDNAGSVLKMRPVAQSVLATCITSDLNNGGNITCASLPGGTLASNYVNAAPSEGGSYQNWEKLASVPGAWDGNFSTGGYAYYVPREIIKDTTFYTPDECNAQDYPVLIVSGISNSNTETTGTSEAAVRIILTTTFEFTTNRTLWDLGSPNGSADLLSFALKSLSLQETSMANDYHLTWLKEFGAKLMKAATTAYSFARENESAIKSLVSAGLLLM